MFYDQLGNQKEGPEKRRFLKRPQELVNQYEYNANSDDSDGEQRLLEGLGQEMGILKNETTEKTANDD